MSGDTRPGEHRVAGGIDAALDQLFPGATMLNVLSRIDHEGVLRAPVIFQEFQLRFAAESIQTRILVFNALGRRLEPDLDDVHTRSVQCRDKA